MRLLYVIDSLAPGGAETSLAAMAPALVAHGIDLHVLPLGRALDLAPTLVTAGAVVHERTGPSGRPGHLIATMQMAKRIRPDLIHTTLYEASQAGRTASRLLSIPSSTSIVGDTYGVARASEFSEAKLELARRVDQATARFATRFHAVSQSLAQSTVRDLRVSPNLIEVIPRGRDPERFNVRSPEVRTKVRSSLGLSERSPVILTVGRLEPPKGLLDLIKALPMVLDLHPDLVVLMAGKDGRATGAIRQAARALPQDAVRFLGHRTDIPDLLAAADLLCFPSLSEGSPGTLIEAMAVGCPILASNIPANLEVLGANDPPVAALTAVGDVSALGYALAAALDDHQGSKERAESARQRFARFYSIDSVTTRMIEFFERAAHS